MLDPRTPADDTAGRLSRRAFLRFVATSSGVSALLAACGSAPSTPSASSDRAAATSGPITVDQNQPTSAAAAAQPTAAVSGASGGTFTFSRGSDSDNFDPVTQDGNVNIWIFMNIYDQLVRVNDAGTQIEPALAEKWDVSSDGLTYTFHLRQGVLFADGSPLKASDVKYSVERAKTNQKSGWTFSLEALKEVTTPDDNTVVMTLSEPWAPFLSDIAMFNASIISEAFARKVGEDELVNQTMGTGPFMLAEWKKGEYVLLKKNPNYWDKGLPLLDEIKITVVPDDNSRILQLQGGQIDGMYNVPLNRVSELGQDPNLDVKQFTSTYNNFIALNTRNAPLSDVKVRQALNYATDKQTLIKVVNFGIGEVSNSFMPNGALYWNKDQVGYPFDLDKAKVVYARLVRGEILAVKHREYVQAAHALGLSDVRIIARHVLPNIITSSVVYAMADIALYIGLAAALSFLGLGAKPPEPEWGAMITEGRAYITTAWWMSVFPGLAMVVTGVGLSLIGDGLADVLRPSGRK